MGKKTVVILACIVISGGLFLFARIINTGGKEPRHRRVPLVCETVSTVPRELPRVQEICYFETEKSLGNWNRRIHEYRGVLRERSTEFVTQGIYSMKVTWKLRKWGEMIYTHFPSGWGRYARFAVDISNPSRDPVDYELRIGDFSVPKHWDYRTSRFVARGTLSPGINRLSFKTSDIAEYVLLDAPRKIIRFRLLTSGSPRTVYVDNMRIER